MEFVREIPESGHYDLIVCGAGPGGTAAAISAARLGKRVLLVEAFGCVGGYLTSGLMGIALDMPGKGGIPREIIQRLLKQNAAQWADTKSYTYEIEAMKLLLETLLTDAGVDVLLYSKLTQVKTEGRRIAGIAVDGMIPQCFTADNYVDGTGHGILSWLSGCGFALGQEATGRQQPASLEALVVGVPKDRWQSDVHNPAVKQKLKDMLMRVGIDSTYPAPLLFELGPGSPIHKLAVNHQYRVTAEDNASAAKATLEARREINAAVQALRTLPGWERLTLVQTGEQLGLRDSRRVHGLQTVTVEDALCGRQFADSVAPVHFCMDVHKLAPDYVPAKREQALRFRPFTIPMGSLIARDMENLFLVGRCISGDFLAHSAYRTVNTAMAMGEAAGIAAAALQGASAHATDGGAIHREMLRRGYCFEAEAQ